MAGALAALFATAARTSQRSGAPVVKYSKLVLSPAHLHVGHGSCELYVAVAKTTELIPCPTPRDQLLILSRSTRSR